MNTIKSFVRINSISDGIELGIIIFFVGIIIWSRDIHPFRIVMTESMLPHIHPGDIVLIKKENSYKVGDIIVYHSIVYDEDIVHRIIDIKTIKYQNQTIECYVTKGDNNKLIDPFPIVTDDGKTINCVPKKFVKGKVIYKIPKIGKPIRDLYMKFFYKND